MSATEATVNLIKLWVLAGCLSVSLLIVGYFFKRLLDSLDARAEETEDRLQKALDVVADQRVEIIQLRSQVTYLAERFAGLEHRLDKRATSRQ